mmetsp:Transcript_7139/g.26262  ORF Transcript_7139/g.26262 Transcript_7139/m.26262 type:complete len:249 (-) Transcript_7139:8-754(-)
MSVRDTTPLVTLMESPPRGYPTAITESCRRGTLANSSGLRSCQNWGSFTVKTARSHACERHRMLAKNFFALPGLRTCIMLAYSTTCALVMMHLSPAWSSVTKPDPVEFLCGRTCHGWAKLGSAFTTNTFRTERITSTDSARPSLDPALRATNSAARPRVGVPSLWGSSPAPRPTTTSGACGKSLSSSMLCRGEAGATPAPANAAPTQGRPLHMRRAARRQARCPARPLVPFLAWISVPLRYRLMDGLS